MDMDIDETAKEKQGKPVVVILVGAPGSGMSTFCEHVYLLRTCHALHSPLCLRLPGYYQKW
ncbi:hypothetical protein ACFX2C_009912 [Malus domestica]